jgi:hypothetical protein
MEKGQIKKTRYVYVVFDTKEIVRSLEKQARGLKNMERSKARPAPKRQLSGLKAQGF